MAQDEVLQTAMDMLDGELELAPYVDEIDVASIMNELTAWVLGRMAESPEIETEAEAEERLQTLIGNAIACAYIAGRIWEGGSTPLNAEIIRKLLETGRVTMSLTLE